MKIEKLELRNKKSGFMIKQCAFEQVNILQAEDTNDAWAIAEALQSMRKFALGLEAGCYADNISRLYFKANHHDYLWFAKTTTKEGVHICPCGNKSAQIVVVDEEEIYNGDSEIIATRDFGHAVLNKQDNLPPVNDTRSLIDLFATDEIAEVRRALANIFSRKLTKAAEIETTLQALPHGALVLLDGRDLAENGDLSGVRSDVQIIAVGNFSGAAVKTVTKKGTALSVK